MVRKPPIRTLKNQYFGINAHLHDDIQATGDEWRSFHGLHIGDLAKALVQTLRPMGYIARIEQSFQIKLEPDLIRYPQSDISIFDQNPLLDMQGDVAVALDNSVALQELLMLSDDDMDYYKSIAIYDDNNQKPVAWIELLSPSNKYGGGLAQYVQKRERLLTKGVVFVEMDYLHELPPTFGSIARYTKHDTHAFPYRIVVTDPRPSIEKGMGYIHHFRVDDPIPRVDIPLNGEDILKFDFNAPYQRTFEEMFYGDKVDYGELPTRFGTYAPHDQLRILSRMLTVIHAGQDVERVAPLPRQFDTLSITEAMVKLRNIKTDG